MCNVHCAIWWTAIRSVWRCCTERSSCRTRRRRRGGCVRARRARRIRSRRSVRKCVLISRIRGCVGETGKVSCADFGMAGRGEGAEMCRRWGMERGRRRRRAGGNPSSALRKGGMEPRSSLKEIRIVGHTQNSFIYSYPYIDAFAFGRREISILQASSPSLAAHSSIYPSILFYLSNPIPFSLCLFPNPIPFHLCLFPNPIPFSLCLFPNPIPFSLCLCSNNSQISHLPERHIIHGGVPMDRPQLRVRPPIVRLGVVVNFIPRKRHERDVRDLRDLP